MADGRTAKSVDLEEHEDGGAIPGAWCALQCLVCQDGRLDCSPFRERFPVSTFADLPSFLSTVRSGVCVSSPRHKLSTPFSITLHMHALITSQH